MINESYKAINAEYAQWLNTLGFSDKVVYDYNFRLRDFLEWLQGQGVQAVTRISPKHVNAYFDFLQTRPNKRRKNLSASGGTGLSVSHLNHNFSAVDKFFEFLHQMGMQTAPTPTNYRIMPDKLERVNKIQPFTQAEIKTLQGNIENMYNELPFEQREAKQEQLKLVFALYYGCALRRSEGGKLRINDIDFEKKTIFIRQGKNYKDRVIPMNDGVYKALEHYLYNFRNLQKLRHKRLFINNTNALNKSLQDLQKACEDEAIRAKRLTLHVLRHSIATHLLQNGMSVESIARFLGHSSLESTQIYTHILEQVS